jgi:hypothetical protein
LRDEAARLRRNLTIGGSSGTGGNALHQQDEKVPDYFRKT